MRVRGLTFVGTSTAARERMAALVRDVLGLPSVPVEGSGHDFFALPDGSTFAIGPSDGAGAAGGDGRTVGFLVDDVDQAAPIRPLPGPRRPRIRAGGAGPAAGLIVARSST